MEKKLKFRIRALLLVFIIALVISGLTAFPLEWELATLNRISELYLSPENPIKLWINKVYEGLRITNLNYPFLSYGTDWLAFAHLVIALIFIGPFRDPVKNIWVLEFGIVACILVFPLAFIAGEFRQIPLYWRILDCAFGAFGLVPLILCHKYVKRLSHSNS